MKTGMNVCASSPSPGPSTSSGPPSPRGRGPARALVLLPLGEGGRRPDEGKDQRWFISSQSGDLGGRARHHRLFLPHPTAQVPRLTLGMTWLSLTCAEVP